MEQDTQVRKEEQRSNGRLLLHSWFVRGREFARNTDGTVWFLWFLLILHYRFTRGIFQGKGSGDGFLGFLMLPGLVFHQSLDLGKPGPEWIALIGRESTGLVANPCPIGPVIFWMPFYLLGLLWQKLALIPVFLWALRLFNPTLQGARVLTGRTEADLYMAGLGSLFAVMWGVRVMFAFLSRNFGKKAARFATVGAVLGTPLFWYATTQPLYQHATSFFAVMMLLDRTDRYSADLSARRCLSLGFWAGFAALQRPQEALWMLPLALNLFWQLGRACKAHDIGQARRVFFCGLLILACATLVFLPQAWVWFHNYGTFRAPQKAGHFLWSFPALVESLFSLRAGVFPWVPLMYGSLFGLCLGLRSRFSLVAPLCLAALLELYVNACAWDYHASWSFGPRRFTDAVPVFAVGLALLCVWVMQRKNPRTLHRLLWFALSVFVVFNLMLTELLRVRRNKSSSAGAFSCATRIGWAQGPKWLEALCRKTGYPFAQPVSGLYALFYRVSLEQAENLLGSYILERDWRIRDVVHTPVIDFSTRPPNVVEGLAPTEQKAVSKGVSLGVLPGGGNVGPKIRVLVPLVVSEPIRFSIEGAFLGKVQTVKVHWNGVPLSGKVGFVPTPVGSARETLTFELDAKSVRARPRWNELQLEQVPEGSSIFRIHFASTSHWWK